jgi:hypothetical protein
MALSKIKSDSIDSIDASKIATGTVDNARITLDAAEIPNLDAAKITTGDIAVARLDNAPATDLTPLRQDINILAIREAVTENKVAYNLPNSFIDHFQDSTGITTLSDTAVNASEYVSTYGTSVSDSGVLNLGVVNFGTGGSGSHGNGSWGTGASSNDHTLDNSGQLGITTDGATTPVVFPASAEFEYHFDPVNTATGLYGPYTCVIPSSYSGNNNCDPWQNTATTHTWGREGVMGVMCGSVPLSTYNGGLQYNPTNATRPTARLATNFNGTVCKIIRNSGMELEFWSGGSKLYTSSSTHTDAYEILIAPQGGHVCYLHNLKYRTVSTVVSTPATGTLVSDQQTVPSAITEMSGVILYKENAGDSVLGTHLKIYFSATGTGASDWVEASYLDVTAEFSTGIKMARLGSTTVPSGTLPTMKAVWASQVASSLETQLHGWAMNY